MNSGFLRRTHVVFCGLIALLFSFQPLIAEDLETRKGKIYKEIEILAVEKEQIKIKHSNGVARVKNTDLPSAFAKRYRIKIPESKAGPAGAVETDSNSLVEEKTKAFARKYKSFTARDGKKYDGTKITSVDPTGLKVTTDAGIKRLKFTELPSYVESFFGFDDAARKKFENAEARKVTARKENAIAAKDARDALNATATKVQLIVVEKSSQGHLCNAVPLEKQKIRVPKRVKVGGALSKEKYKIKYVEVEKEAKAGTRWSVLVKDFTSLMKKGSDWKGTLYVVGEHRYRAANGVEYTAPLCFSKRKAANEYILSGQGLGSGGSGTGFYGAGVVLSTDGYIATANHVVANAKKITVWIGKKKYYSAEVVAQDAKSDVAILKARGSRFKPVPVADSKEIALGDSVFTIGFPAVEEQGHEAKLAKGDILALNGLRNASHLLQISMPIQEGSAGGGIFNEKGFLVGLATRPLAAYAKKGKSSRLNFAVKSKPLLKLAQTVKELQILPVETTILPNPFTAGSDATVYVDVIR